MDTFTVTLTKEEPEAVVVGLAGYAQEEQSKGFLTRDWSEADRLFALMERLDSSLND